MESIFPTGIHAIHLISLSDSYFNYFPYHSPFKFKVRPSSEPDRVKVIGPVVTNKGGVFASIPTEFTVDTSQAGVGNLDVQVTVCSIARAIIASLTLEQYNTFFFSGP